MKKELTRHIEILKIVPEIKEDIEEMKLGCRFTGNHNEGFNIIYFVQEHNIVDLDGDVYHFEGEKDDRFIIKDIIGQVEERHLRMFLTAKKGIATFKGGNTTLWSIKNMEEESLEFNEEKPYMEQSEEFFKELNDWLVNEFNIELGKQ